MKCNICHSEYKPTITGQPACIDCCAKHQIVFQGAVKSKSETGSLIFEIWLGLMILWGIFSPLF